MQKQICAVAVIVLCAGLVTENYNQPVRSQQWQFNRQFQTSTLIQHDTREVAAEVTNALYGFCQDGKWGIINGTGEIIVTPTHAFSGVLPNGMYLLSDNPEKINTGKIYTPTGERLFPEYGDITVFGGGPDCNTAYVETDVFLYEKNGLKGIIRNDGVVITDALYDDIRGDYYKGVCYYTLKDGKFGIATLEGEVAPPVFENYPSVLGRGDVLLPVTFACGYVDGIQIVYKDAEVFFIPDENCRLEQIQGCFLYYTPQGIVTMDENLNILHRFEPDIRITHEGPDGPYSINGLLYLYKDVNREEAMADKLGNMIVPFGAHSIHLREDLQIFYVTENGKTLADFYNLEGQYLYTKDTDTLPEYGYSYRYDQSSAAVFPLELSGYPIESSGYFIWVSDGSHPEDIYSTIYTLMSASFAPY